MTTETGQSMSINPNQTNALDAFQVPKDVYTAIKKASAATGVNFSYMVKKAAVESGFDADAKAKTSSATGLYQFIESTWLTMVNKHGDKYGLSKYADKIGDDLKVSDPKTRKEILNLRKDPEIASYMAAEFDRGNYDQLKDNVGGNIGSTELYMAHFLGAGGASGFLNAMKKSPDMAGADLFPKEARSNRAVFYEKTGEPRSLKQIYAFFDKKFDGGGSTQFAANTQQDSILRTTPSAPATNQIATEDENPFNRLASLMGLHKPAPQSSMMMRLSDAQTQTQAQAQNNWQIFPPSLYNRLSLTSAQMMMLSDFDA